MSRWTVALAALGGIVAVVSGNGCRGCRRQPGVDEVMAGAVYARQVPIYPGAVFGTMMHESATDDPDAPDDVSTRAWHFKVSDPPDQVAAFYQSRLPGAAKEQSDDEVIFTVVPTGAKDGDVIAISVLPHELTITEVVAAKPTEEPGAASTSPASGG